MTGPYLIQLHYNYSTTMNDTTILILPLRLYYSVLSYLDINDTIDINTNILTIVLYSSSSINCSINSVHLYK